MCLWRAGGERAERAPTRTREQAERSFSLGPGVWGDPAPEPCPGLDEISAPQEGICARYRWSDLGVCSVSGRSHHAEISVPCGRLEAVASPLVSVGSLGERSLDTEIRENSSLSLL